MEQDDSPPSTLPVPLPSSQSGLMLDVGAQSRRRIKRLRRGDGQLARRIHAAVDAAREQLGIDPAAEIVPIVVLYRRGKRYPAVVLGQS
jgi:hypothetical protein